MTWHTSQNERNVTLIGSIYWKYISCRPKLLCFGQFIANKKSSTVNKCLKRVRFFIFNCQENGGWVLKHECTSLKDYPSDWWQPPIKIKKVPNNILNNPRSKVYELVKAIGISEGKERYISPEELGMRNVWVPHLSNLDKKQMWKRSHKGALVIFGTIWLLSMPKFNEKFDWKTFKTDQMQTWYY